MKNISFGLFAAEELVSASGTSIPADGLIEIISLSENGKAVIKTDLPFGSYYVKELATDEHYILTDAKYPFTFSYAGQDTANVEIAVNDGKPIENKLIYGSVSGKKITENGEALGGAVIGLFKADETEFTKENALMTATSQKDGSFSFEKVPYGNWLVREIEQPEGFVLDETSYEVKISEVAQVIEVEIVNEYVHGNIKLTKVDEDYPDNKLTGATFEVYKDVNGDGKLDDADELIGTLSETSTGIYEMKELLYGKYLVRETKAPDGFELDKGVYSVFIEKDETTYEVENKAGVGFINTAMKGNLKIVKTSSDGKVEGFTFRVTGVNGYDRSFTTDKNGEIIIEGLRIGDYTISINKKSVEDARTYFARVGADLIAHFARLGSKCVELETDERLRIVHDFFRVGEETAYHFNIKETRKKGHDFKDYVCPDTMEFEKDYFKMGNRYGRVLFLREYASYIKDSMVAELTDLNRNLMMSIDIVPVPTDEAVREAESRLLGVETNITNWQRKQNQNNNFSATVPYDMEQQKKEMKEFLDDLTTRDQRMMFAVLTMVHTADSKEQLDNDTEALLTTARKHLCQFAVLKYQQMDGLNTAMPFGTRKIDAFRTLTTESLAVFIPFRVQDIYHENGIYYGQNVISKNMIIADRRQLLNGNSFILGVSGGGKSFAAKGEIENIILSSNADVIIIDPEREYSQLVKALGGEIINISATSPSHINAMDMNKEYGDGANPVILKSEFIMSLCEQLIGGTNLGAKQKSIIDRCTASVYRDYQQRGYTGTVPTLQDFRAELLKQDEPEAKEIALAIELFTHGSLNTFAKPTNVDTDNRLICYDILDLGKQLMPIGMLVVLDSILNRITQNRAKGKQTFIFIDEIYLLFQHEYSANFLFTLWKRVRKYGAYATGITQNVDDLLQSHTARTMLANSEFLIMLNQASTDRIELAKLLNISDLQLSYITNVDAGHGLIKVGSSLVPFANKFPKNTKLYKLMTTKPGEGA